MSIENMMFYNDLNNMEMYIFGIGQMYKKMDLLMLLMNISSSLLLMMSMQLDLHNLLILFVQCYILSKYMESLHRNLYNFLDIVYNQEKKCRIVSNDILIYMLYMDIQNNLYFLHNYCS